MAYGMKRYGTHRRYGRRYGMRRMHPGLHGQRLHRTSRAGRYAAKVARRTYRKNLKLPKRVLAKKDANTVGQIVYKEAKRGQYRPSHRRY